METQSVPDVFEGAREYKGDSDALELAQKTFNEEALYQEIASFASKWYVRTQRKPDILDLCSATGLCARRVARAIPAASVTLVDVDCEALRRGKKYLEGGYPVSAHCTDAVTFDDGKVYDLILMNSAYHHIEDERKVSFLVNAADLLAQGGRILVGEHFLPSYSGCDEFRRSVVTFYEALIGELEERGEPEKAVNVIRKSGLYCWEEEYEYKVSWEVFRNHFLEANLGLIDLTQEWSIGNDSEVSGSFAVCLHLF